MTYRTRPTPQLRRDLRLLANQLIQGRASFEQKLGRVSDKPLRKIELDPREVLQILDDPSLLQVDELLYTLDGVLPSEYMNRVKAAVSAMKE